MDKIRVIVSGCGGVGSRLIRLLAEKEGVEIVGVIDIAPNKVGRDAGEMAGGKPLGVVITSDALSLYRAGADIVICTSAPTSQAATFQLMRPALEHGIRVVVANMGTCDLRVTDPELAREVDAVCKKHGVTYFGIGATQMQDRFILLQTEGSASVNKLTFTHFADMHAFDPSSFQREWGVGLTETAYREGQKNGTIEKHDYFADGIVYIGHRLGWSIDRVGGEQAPLVDGAGMVYGSTFKFTGYQGEQARIETNWIFLLDEERRYYDQVIVDGVPQINSMNTFSPDRGMVSTFASLVNSIPLALSAAPGYVNTLDLPACTLYDDDIRRHIRTK